MTSSLDRTPPPVASGSVKTARVAKGLLAAALLSSFAAVSVATPGAAQAQSGASLVVLGIRSVEGDDEFTRNLTGALRHAASQVAGWEVSDREVTLAQMALAHGCDDPDPTCMAAIADSLEVQRVLYGDVRRTSAGDSFDFSINLHLFNGETDQIEHSVADTIPGVRRDIDDLREPVRGYVSQLSGAPRVGTIRVSVNVPGAEIFIDGEPVGVADDNGQLVVEDVQAGTRNVRVAAVGHQGFRSSIPVEAYREAAFEAELQAGGPGGGGGEPFPTQLVLGVGLLVVAVGLAAAWIGSWAHLQFGIGSNDGLVSTQDWQDAKEAYRGSSDFCAETMAPAGGGDVSYVQDLCDQASTFEALQFVFGIGAAVAGGIGLYFLLDALLGGDAAEGGQDVTLLPSVSPEGGYLGLHVAF